MSHDNEPFHPVVRNLEEDRRVSQKDTIIFVIPKIKKVKRLKVNVILHTSGTFIQDLM
jgi:hypothetical protein